MITVGQQISSGTFALDVAPEGVTGPDTGIVLAMITGGQAVHHFATWRYAVTASGRVDLFSGDYHADLTGAVRSFRGRSGKAI